MSYNFFSFAPALPYLLRFKGRAGSCPSGIPQVIESVRADRNSSTVNLAPGLPDASEPIGLDLPIDIMYRASRPKQVDVG